MDCQQHQEAVIVAQQLIETRLSDDFVALLDVSRR
jgi:hypothetical protein